MQLRTKWLDFTSVGLSMLCLMHCLALPVLFAVMPALELFLPHEVVHKVLVLFAAPISLWTLQRSQSWTRWEVSLPMLSGLVILALAAFVPALYAYDAVMSVSGALLVAAGHLIRYFFTARPAPGHVHSVDCHKIH
jgi:hypothetical protein